MSCIIQKQYNSWNYALLKKNDIVNNKPLKHKVKRQGNAKIKVAYVSINCGISSKSSNVVWLASNVWLSFLSSKICCADSTNSVQPDVKFGISSIYNGAWTTWSNISNHSSKVAWIIEVHNVSIYHIERKKMAEYNNEHVIYFTLYPLVLLDWKSSNP